MAVLTEEQTMLRDSAREWIRDRVPLTALRLTRDAGAPTDPAVYAEMAAMGWTGIMVPEEHGGSGLGLASAGLLLEEMGRTLVSSPFLSTAVCATTAIANWGSEKQKQRWLPRLVEGRVTVALAIDEGHRHAPGAVAMQASAKAGGYRLTGQKTFVAGGMAADLFIAYALCDAGPTLFLVPGDADGVTRSALTLIDHRDYATVAFHDVQLGEDAVLGAPGQGAARLEAILDTARAAVAAEMLGLSAEAFDVTLAYLNTREQFGTVLARFQALQHRMAMLFTRMQLVRSVVEHAVRAIDDGMPDASESSIIAKAMAGDLANLMTREMVQLHGGIGMTDAHDAGLFLKRARALEAIYGTSAQMCERYARMHGY